MDECQVMLNFVKARGNLVFFMRLLMRRIEHDSAATFVESSNSWRLVKYTLKRFFNFVSFLIGILLNG